LTGHQSAQTPDRDLRIVLESESFRLSQREGLALRRRRRRSVLRLCSKRRASQSKEKNRNSGSHHAWASCGACSGLRWRMR
jgi:hypothetical protein